MRALVVVTNSDWTRPENPHRAVSRGLERIGYRVDRVSPGDWPVVTYRPDVVFIWNGVKGRRAGIVNGFRDLGIPVFVMEHGFFDRMRYTQIDYKGFNHRASWAGKFTDSGVRRRLENVFPNTKPMRIRDRGKAVVLCQVPDDAQLTDSELRCPRELVKHFVRAAEGLVEVEYRPHPLYPFGDVGGAVQCDEDSLTRLVDEARFAITINSNSGNEALGWGCPVLCLGPSLYGAFGAALETKVADLRDNIRKMLDGFRPSQVTVGRYLETLANRQWSNCELADGAVLEKLFKNAAINREFSK